MEAESLPGGGSALSPRKGLYQAVRGGVADTQTSLQWGSFAWVGMDTWLKVFELVYSFCLVCLFHAVLKLIPATYHMARLILDLRSSCLSHPNTGVTAGTWKYVQLEALAKIICDSNIFHYCIP